MPTGTLTRAMPPSALERSPFVAASQAQDALWAYEKSGDLADLHRAVQAVIEAVDALAVRQAELPAFPWWHRWRAHVGYRLTRWRATWREWRRERAHRRQAAVAKRDLVRRLRVALLSTARSATWEIPHDSAFGGPCWCDDTVRSSHGDHVPVCVERRVAVGVRPRLVLRWWGGRWTP